jgi:hypothetical protein
MRLFLLGLGRRYSLRFLYKFSFLRLTLNFALGLTLLLIGWLFRFRLIVGLLISWLFSFIHAIFRTLVGSFLRIIFNKLI